MSEDKKLTVVEALLAVMDEIGPIAKGERNPEFNYDFRGVDTVMNVVGPILRKHRVIVIPLLRKATYRDVQTSRGKPSREATVEVGYRFYGPAGDYVDAAVPGEAMDSGDKGTPKAMSVAYRVLLLQTFCIPTGEPDPDSTVYERGEEVDREAPQPSPESQKFAYLRSVVQAKDLDEGQVPAAFTAFTGVAPRDADVETIQKYIDHVQQTGDL